jgi:hypothetical protein
MPRLILAFTLWLAAFATFVGAGFSLRDDLRYGDAAIEAEATVTAHLLGPAVALQPGRVYTSLALAVGEAGQETYDALLHGQLDPPPVGARLRVRYPADEPTAIRRGTEGLARFAESGMGGVWAVLLMLLAWAATLGCRDAAPRWQRFGPGLAVGLALSATGLLLVSTLAYDAALVSTRYQSAAATVVGVERCGDLAMGRGARQPLWCPRLRYVVDGTTHAVLGPARLAQPEAGAETSVRVHPDRPDFAVSEGVSDLALLLSTGAAMALLGLYLTVRCVAGWRRARSLASPTTG